MRAVWALVLMCTVGCADDGSDDPGARPDATVGLPEASLDARAATPDASLDARVAAPEAGLDAQSAAPPNPASVVWFVPDDNSRLAADGGLGLSVYGFSPRRSHEDSLRELADALELVRWPSAERLPAQVRYDLALPAYTMQVTLHPAHPLAEGRYALRLKQSLPNAQFNTNATAVIDGLPTSRFYVGSDPVVRRIEVCDKAGGRTKLLVAFSEPVHGGTLEVFAGSTALQCDPPMTHGAWLDVLCASSITASVRVRFVGFSSDTGVPLENEAGGAPDYSFALGSLPTFSCPAHVPGR